MTILDILKQTKWTDIKKAIKYFYPDDKNNYKQIYIELKRKQKQQHFRKDEQIKLIFVRENIIGDSFYAISTNKYSLSFRLWSELVNIPISKTTLQHYSNEDIIAHFIWEITFYGTEKNMMSIANELDEYVKEFKNKQKSSLKKRR